MSVYNLGLRILIFQNNASEILPRIMEPREMAGFLMAALREWPGNLLIGLSVVYLRLEPRRADACGDKALQHMTHGVVDEVRI
jgi:hypothetical protein